MGPANRLASAAARRAAESPGTSYNPLFIYAASGLGKSHILCAIANAAHRRDAELRIVYEPVELYLDELATALQAGKRDELRDRFGELDVLLLDDVQFLTGHPEAQEMFLGTLDALTRDGRQVVLASDRPPAEINGLDARLVSRFSGGLIVDIAVPELETRVAIVMRRTEQLDQTLEGGVAEAIARVPVRNVRELGGALNKVLAIQELEDRKVEAAEVAGIVGEGSPGRDGGSGEDDFSSFLDEISADLAQVVESQEAVWRRELRNAAEAAEQEGFANQRLKIPLAVEVEPEGWRGLLDSFQTDIARLRAIQEELDRLDNPWPELTEDLIRDPDRMHEAESFLESVRERRKPFGVLGPGPKLEELAESVPALALKAAQQLITNEKPNYNPLYLWSADGSGPATLVGASFRTYRDLNPDLRIALTSVPDFAEDFVRALSEGVAGAWRERWWTVDMLIVLEAEALALTERAQDEFFHLFESLKRRGSRLMMVGDRPPSEIESIDERLCSRFEGGLVLELDEVEIDEGWDDLTIHDPGELTGITVGGDSEAPASEEAAPSAPDHPTPHVTGGKFWTPSREKVVLRWRDLNDRLVENLD